MILNFRQCQKWAGCFFLYCCSVAGEKETIPYRCQDKGWGDVWDPAGKHGSCAGQ